MIQQQRTDAGALYIDLLVKCLTRLAFEEPYEVLRVRSPGRARALAGLQRVIGRFGLEIVRQHQRSAYRRERGRDWPARAETMIGLKRLDNIRFCVEDVLARDVPGDLIEAGVWRGGATIFMRGILKAHGDTARIVWVADSFKGLPPPSKSCEPDLGTDFSAFPELAVPLDEVKANFARYGLLDDQVRFIEGFFQDTLPQAPIERLAVARLDGDMYESTIVSLEALYPKLSPGGYLIVDDYGLEACRRAVDDYRRRERIDDQILEIDHTGVYWQRSE